MGGLLLRGHISLPPAGGGGRPQPHIPFHLPTGEVVLFYELMKQRKPIPEPGCSHPHPPPPAQADPRAVERAARLFRAMGDPQRLALLQRLSAGECCVTELVTASGEKFPTVSARLRILRTEGLIRRRRSGLHVYYALADDHVGGLISNALAHADELNRPHSHPTEERT
jgi:ArsR family transcriptional regulator, lead/cadmium/zinc/bismuth-responsive transcriptional repressor